MVALEPIFKKAYWSLVGFGALYGAFLVSVSFKNTQRHALYLHKAQSEYFHNLSRPESLGFANNQITSFTLPTPDGEELYAWHILPLGLYAEHEDDLLKKPPTMSFQDSLPFKLLTTDPEARVVINFHGNAGNLAQGYRPQTYKSLTSASSKIHILTVDYRGFGRSSGIPSEAGLIADGVALVQYALDLGIPASRIVILGQSLGTQVAAGVALHFASPSSSTALLPSMEKDINPGAISALSTPNSNKEHEEAGTTFASIILAASFPSLPELLKVYRLAGLLPLLTPLRVYPSIQSFVLKFVHETWSTSSRLRSLIKSVLHSKGNLNLQIMHAADDWDISWRMGRQNFDVCVDAVDLFAQTNARGEEVRFGKVGDVWGEAMKESVEFEGVKVEWTLLMQGGHNRIVADVPVALAVMRAFGL